jgi:hypothetical protein
MRDVQICAETQRCVAMSRAIPLVFLLLGSCYAAPPAPASPQDLGGCAPGAHGALGEQRCSRDEDCVLCGCELRSRRELLLSNEACPSAECEGATASCCQNRCVTSRDATALVAE